MNNGVLLSFFSFDILCTLGLKWLLAGCPHTLVSMHISDSKEKKEKKTFVLVTDNVWCSTYNK